MCHTTHLYTLHIVTFCDLITILSFPYYATFAHAVP